MDSIASLPGACLRPAIAARNQIFGPAPYWFAELADALPVRALRGSRFALHMVQPSCRRLSHIDSFSAADTPLDVDAHERTTLAFPVD